MSTFSLVTANMEYGNRSRKLIQEKGDILSKCSPDIILIQESNTELINFDKYFLVKYDDLCNKEKMDIYIRKDSMWEQSDKNMFNSNLGHTGRPTKIIVLKNKITKKEIKISNIHLIGGRFEENDKDGKMLIGNLKDIRNRKTEVLKKLINSYDIDIVAGDFNSDVKCYLNGGILQEGHLKFLQKVSPNKSYEIYREWNIAPFNYLDKNGFKIVKKLDLVNTSLFNTHPDSIFYKEKNFEIINHKYIDLITDDLSDHNAIYTSFNVL